MYTPLGGKWVFKVSTFYAGDELLHYDATFDSDGTGTSEDVSTQRSQALELFDDDCPVRVGQATLRVRKKGRKRERDKQRVVKKKRKTEKKKRKDKKLLEKLLLERSRKRVMRPPLQSEV